MSDRSIFLSYRRDDSPGYVSRLEDSLEAAFGADRVFRDVQDIDAGRKWKAEIARTLDAAEVLILVMGPRWEAIWKERSGDEVDYLRLELNHARERDIPVIPVTLGGVTLSPDLDLGDCAWLLDNQLYDISDVQGRWERDVEGLVRLLDRSHGLRRKPVEDGSPTKRRSPALVLVAAATVVVLAVVVFGVIDRTSPGVQPGPGVAPPSRVPGAATGQIPTRGPGANTQDPPVRQAQIETAPEATATANPPATAAAAAEVDLGYPVPDIGGLWRGRDGTDYRIEQSTHGTFAIESPGNPGGTGRFIRSMPNKMSVTMGAAGDGEFAVSTSGQTMIGWIVVNGRKRYDTLTRVSP